MSFSAPFLASAKRAFGAEAIRVRLWTRIATAAGANQLVELTALGGFVSVSAIEEERERQFGVAQGQRWEITLDNSSGWANPRSAIHPFAEPLELRWCALEYDLEGNTELGAQGRISRVFRSTQTGTVTIQVGDPIMDLLDYDWPRDAVFDERDRWISGVQPVVRADASSSYSGATGPTALGTTAQTSNETFRLVFATATTFDVVYEDGTTQSGGPFPIGSNLDVVSNVSSVAVARLYASDWAGSYATGDEFVFYTSKAYTAGNLAPVFLMMDLLGQAGAVSAYDVKAGTTLSIFHDILNWVALNTYFSGILVRGYQSKGTSLASMIQGLLKVIHGAIYTTPTGQIALYAATPGAIGAGTGTPISGDPKSGLPVVISRIDAEMSDDEIVTVTTWTYSHLGFPAGAHGGPPVTEQATVTRFADPGFVDPITLQKIRRGSDHSIPWAVTGSAIVTAAERLVARYGTERPYYTIQGPLALLEHDLNDAVTVYEPALDVVAEKLQVVSRATYPTENYVEILAYADPVVSSSFFIIGQSVIDGSDLIF